MRNTFKRQTISMRGRVVDMDALRAQNEGSVALGNARMNARGDILGPNAMIEVRREQIIQDYYKGNPQVAQPVSLKSAQPDVFETPAEAMARMAATAAKPDSVSPEEMDAPEGMVIDRKAVRKLIDKED